VRACVWVLRKGSLTATSLMLVVKSRHLACLRAWRGVLLFSLQCRSHQARFTLTRAPRHVRDLHSKATAAGSQEVYITRRASHMRLAEPGIGWWRSLSRISGAGTRARRKHERPETLFFALAASSHQCVASRGFWLHAGDAFVTYAPVPHAPQTRRSNPKATSEPPATKTAKCLHGMQRSYITPKAAYRRNSCARSLAGDSLRRPATQQRVQPVHPSGCAASV
jgi:hypothetical protein